MDKDWFPFFSALLWFVTKVAGLVMLLYGLVSLHAVLLLGAGFVVLWNLLFMAALPTMIGFALLKTDLLHEIATSAMNASRRERTA